MLKGIGGIEDVVKDVVLCCVDATDFHDLVTTNGNAGRGVKWVRCRVRSLEPSEGGQAENVNLIVRHGYGSEVTIPPRINKNLVGVVG